MRGESGDSRAALRHYGRAAAATHGRTAGMPSAWPTAPTRWRRRFRGACGGGWRLRAGWCTTRRFCFWTSRPPAWTRPRAFRCGRLISHLRAQQGHTLFLTTHYMDEADRLCDRVAIVEGGRIVALDTPVALKGVGARRQPHRTAIRAGSAATAWPTWRRLPAVKSVRALGTATYRVSSDSGPASAQELIELARERKLELKSLSVQSTSLDDVFLHYTGHGLAEMGEAAAPAGRQEERRPPMKRALALVERDMRKFRRSPALLVASLVLPLLQLIILGNAFGGNIKNVDSGRGQPGPWAAIGGCAGAGPRGGRECAHVPAHGLRRPGRRYRRPAQGRAGRGADHSAALFARPAGTAPAAPGADYRQHGSLGGGRRRLADGGPGRRPSTRPRSRRANRSRPRWMWWRSIPISTT